MSMRIIRKALGLLVVDIVLIIGIFVLQFRTDSTILEKIGNLQVTMALTEGENEVPQLKNKLQIAYNGVNYYCDDQNPAQIVKKGEENRTNVSLVNWEKKDLSFDFTFTEDVVISFVLSSDDADAALNAHVKLPDTVSEFYLPYNLGYNMKIQKDEQNRIILDGKKNTWEFTAVNLSKGYIAYNKDYSNSSYAIYDNTHQFGFDSITDIALAASSAYNNTVTNFKANLISAFKANTLESNVTEQAVVSYIAAQAEKGSYVQAIEEIPQSFKRSKIRTYLSAPYLNTLDEMNSILDKTIAENEQLITRSASNTTLDIYTVRNLAAYMYIHPNSNAVKTVLKKAADADISMASLAQVTGILQVYVDLLKYDTSLADILLPVLDSCIDRIEKACAYDGTLLTISENDTFLSVIQAVETGVAVKRYGAAVGNQTLIKAGSALVNSYITENSSFDLRTLSNLYPILAYDNWYYPHFAKIENTDGRKLWAWTCAKSITYSSENKDSFNMLIDFPENYTHYVIFKGVPSFKTIYIYNMAFRTDPRFETYNSSGYVYLSETKALLLKSRHKQRYENIKLDLYSADYVAPPRPAPAPKPAEPAPETTATAETPAEGGEQTTTAPAEASTPASAE